MNEKQAREQMAVLTAAFDQFREAGRELAGVMCVYRESLIAGGMPEVDALQMTIAYQATVMALATQMGNE